MAALINGTTISIESSAAPAYQGHLLPALAKGLVTLPQLQAAAKRALLPRFRVGLYDPPSLVPWNLIPASVIESAPRLIRTMPSRAVQQQRVSCY